MVGWCCKDWQFAGEQAGPQRESCGIWWAVCGTLCSLPGKPGPLYCPQPCRACSGVPPALQHTTNQPCLEGFWGGAGVAAVLAAPLWGSLPADPVGWGSWGTLGAVTHGRWPFAVPHEPVWSAVNSALSAHCEAAFPLTPALSHCKRSRWFCVGPALCAHV